MSRDFKNLKNIMKNIDQKKSIEKIIKQQNTEHTLRSFDTRNYFTGEGQKRRLDFLKAVSYTHLTLPTIYSV